MKKILLCLAVSLTTQFAFAGDSVVPLGRGGFGVLRGGGNMYRPIPREMTGLGTGSARTVLLKPTQHYYTKDNVVSYRYAEDRASNGSAGATYNGPRGAIFQAGDDHASRNASIRTFAAMNKRPQPGVPMVPKRAVASSGSNKSTPRSATTTIVPINPVATR